MTRTLAIALAAAALAAAAGCGGAAKTGARSTTTAARKQAAAPTTTAPGPLQAEANAAATGDIPDSQAFIVLRNRIGSYSMKYPEGWAQLGSGGVVTLRDKNNIVRIVVEHGAAPTTAAVKADVAKLGGARLRSGPAKVALGGKPALEVTYSTQSAPNAVTGKRVTLIVDRYYLWQGGRRAVVDLGTPEGVDNVDAYRMMIESFRWS